MYEFNEEQKRRQGSNYAVRTFFLSFEIVTVFSCIEIPYSISENEEKFPSTKLGGIYAVEEFRA